MSHGGRRLGAGRKPGVPTAKTAAIAAKAFEEGITPLEVMLRDMRMKYEAGDISAAADRARDAAPFMHARLAATEAKIVADINTPDAVDRPPRETREEWIARRNRELGYDGAILGAAAGAAE